MERKFGLAVLKQEYLLVARELQSFDGLYEYVGAGTVRNNTLDAEVQDQIDMLQKYS